MMFAVHFLSKRVMIDRWLQDEVIHPSSQSGETPRIVFIASESHRSSHTIDFDHFGAFTDYGIKEGLKYYGISKLVLCTFATELSRRLNPGENVEIAVHAMCPGGVATNIARDAPVWLKPLVNPLLKRFFQSPQRAEYVFQIRQASMAPVQPLAGVLAPLVLLCFGGLRDYKNQTM